MGSHSLFESGVVEIAAGIGLVSGGTGAAGGGIAGSVATGGASLLVTAAGASAISAGWTAIVQGATGALAGLATIADSMSMMSSGSGSGSSVKPPTSETKPVHGNDLSTTKPAHGYSLRDRHTDEILKYGETTLGRGRYTKQYLDKHNARMVFEAKGTKAEMHKWQHEKILQHKAGNNGNRPPLNKSDW